MSSTNKLPPNDNKNDNKIVNTQPYDAKRDIAMAAKNDNLNDYDIAKTQAILNSKWEFGKWKSKDEYLQHVADDSADLVEMYGPDEATRMVNEYKAKNGEPLIRIYPTDNGGADIDLLDDYNRMKEAIETNRQALLAEKWEFGEWKSKDEYLQHIADNSADLVEEYGPKRAMQFVNEYNSKNGEPLVCIYSNDRGGVDIDLLDDYNKARAMARGIDYDKNTDAAERKAIFKPKEDNTNRIEDIYKGDDSHIYDNNKNSPSGD